MPVTSAFAAHSTHPYQKALLSLNHVLSLKDPSQTSAIVFPSSSIVILSNWILPVLSSLTVCQASCNQLRVVSLTWSHIIITRMAEPVGLHEVPQTSAHSSKQAREPDTSSCFFLKTNPTWAFHLLSLLPKQSGPEIAELLNTQHKTNEPFPSNFKTTFTDPQSWPSPLLVLFGSPSWLAELVASLSSLETYHPCKNLEMSPQSCPFSGQEELKRLTISTPITLKLPVYFLGSFKWMM